MIIPEEEKSGEEKNNATLLLSFPPLHFFVCGVRTASDSKRGKEYTFVQTERNVLYRKWQEHWSSVHNY